MAGYTYTSFKLAAQTIVVSNGADIDFDNILPSAIDYANERCLRELNLLNTVQVDNTTVTTTLGARLITIPSTFVVVNEMSVFTPAGSTESTGTRVPLTPVSRAVLDALWPSRTVTGEPSMFNMQDQFTALLGACPDGAYQVEVVGTYRPAPISPTVATSFLTTYLPDLFFAASMVFFALYMRNFASAQGQSGNDPMMSGNWEAQYQTLFKSADSEEARKHGWGSSWTAYPVAPGAQPQRG